MMKYLTEFRDGEIAQKLAKEIRQVTTGAWRIMEVCGGQTHSIIRNGIDQLLPEGIELIHGPGCPVCVTPLEVIDKALAIAATPDVIFCSFGDMLRVPGSQRDLFAVKSQGGDVRIVYSPLDAVRLARENPSRQVVFFAIGFETTAPANAMAVHLANKEGLANFSMLVSHVLVPPAIDAIMNAPGNRVQAFLAAGHVCSVMGYWQYPPLAQRHQVPIVITGFEPLDVLDGIRRAVTQLESGDAFVENGYARVVTEEGNRTAQELLNRVFTVSDRAWRGIGMIPESGWRLSDEYAEFDAERRFDVATIETCESSLVSGGRGPAGCDQAAPVRRRSENSARRERRSVRRWFQARAHVRLTTTTAVLLRLGKEEVPRSLEIEKLTCPLPLRDYPNVILGHGGGGKLSAELVQHLFLPAFGNATLESLTDSVVLPRISGRPVFSTDSYVVRPLFFPGGSIGDLAVNGTVNDLAMSGARPLYLSAGFIIEEGFSMEELTRVVHAMATAAKLAGVQIVTGDTKVVDRGHGDGVYINTAGVGELISEAFMPSPANIRPGDADCRQRHDR